MSVSTEFEDLAVDFLEREVGIHDLAINWERVADRRLEMAKEWLARCGHSLTDANQLVAAADAVVARSKNRGRQSSAFFS